MERLRYLSAYDQHKLIINEYVLNRPGNTKFLQRDASKDKTDVDVIRENHRFLWSDGDVDTWGKHFAKKYYDKLFKEYAICDLSRYKENKVALRWRIEKEVIDGKGQFVCGNKVCAIQEELRSWEVNFTYKEENEKKNALVKLRLCPNCSTKLNYHSKKREIKRIKQSKKSSHRKPAKSRTSSETDSLAKSPENQDEASVEPATKIIVEHQKKIIAELNAGDHWSRKVVVEEELTREEEFEKYLEDLLL